MGVHVSVGAFVSAPPDLRVKATLSNVRCAATTALLTAAVWLGCLSHGAAQDGATLLSEDFQDWRVLCTQQDDGRVCMMRQDQTRSNGERLLAMEIREPRDDGVLGILLLPFGIVFEAGITPRIDDHPPMGALSFRTCLPSGCLAVFPINERTMERMSKGASLDLEVTTLSGETLTFPVSLRGFTAAYERLSAVTSQ